MTLSEISQSQKTNTACFHLHEVPGVENVETESGFEVSRGGGEGELLFNGYRFSVLQDERRSTAGK